MIDHQWVTVEELAERIGVDYEDRQQVSTAAWREGRCRGHKIERREVNDDEDVPPGTEWLFRVSPDDEKELPGDQWKWVPDYEGRYAVSRGGEVVSYVGTSPRLLTPSKDQGYERVNLRRGGETRTVYVHTLVLEAFRDGVPEGMDTRHLNGDRSDNRLENLRVGTRSENEADKVRHGVSNRGERCGAAKLTRDEVREIRKRHSNGEEQQHLADEFGVSAQHVSGIVNRKYWRHI